MSFNEGDAVQMKSGGPKMTYVGDDEIGEAMCVWFDKTTQKRGSFPKSSLEKYEPPSLSGSLVRG